MSLSKARQTGAIPGVAGGFAPLDSGLLVPLIYLPPSPGTAAVVNNLVGTASEASDTTLVSATAVADVDARLQATFTGPASGFVIVTIEGWMAIVSGFTPYHSIREGSTVISPTEYTPFTGGGNQSGHKKAKWLIPVSAGASHTLKWSTRTDGGGSSQVKVGPTYGDATLTIEGLDGADGSISTQLEAIATPTSSGSSFSDILFLNLGPGTWIVTGNVSLTGGSGGNVILDIYDGTTVYATVETTVSGGTLNHLTIVSTPIVLTAPTMVRLRARSNSGSPTILASNAVGGTNKATTMVAQKVA